MWAVWSRAHPVLDPFKGHFLNRHKICFPVLRSCYWILLEGMKFDLCASSSYRLTQDLLEIIWEEAARFFSGLFTLENPLLWFVLPQLSGGEVSTKSSPTVPSSGSARMCCSKSPAGRGLLRPSLFQTLVLRECARSCTDLLGLTSTTQCSSREEHGWKDLRKGRY